MSKYLEHLIPTYLWAICLSYFDSSILKIFYIYFAIYDENLSQNQLPKINKIFKNTKIFRKNIQYISLLSKLFIAKKTWGVVGPKSKMFINKKYADFDDHKLLVLVFCKKIIVFNGGMFPLLRDCVCV